MENIVGWYHSHPGYGCWLSGIDVTTQMTNQKYQEPFLAIVVDPHRTVAAGKVEIGAFRTYPEVGGCGCAWCLRGVRRAGKGHLHLLPVSEGGEVKVVLFWLVGWFLWVLRLFIYFFIGKRHLPLVLEDGAEGLHDGSHSAQGQSPAVPDATPHPFLPTSCSPSIALSTPTAPLCLHAHTELQAT
jgi:hypothetical protein